MSTFNKIYKKVANNGNSNDYQVVGQVGVNGVNLDIMKGANSSSAGEIGLVPKPSAGASNRYLRSDGTWSVPPEYSHPTYTSRSNGLYKIAVDGTGHVNNVSSVTKSDITSLGIPGQDTTYELASSDINGLMSSKDKSLITDLLRNGTTFLFWTDDNVNFGTIKGGGEDYVYKVQECTKYIYENKTDDEIYYAYYPLLKKVAESNGKLGYEPIASGCTFGNFDSLWNEGYATCEKVVKDGKNAIKIFYRLYANARSYAGTHSVTGRAKVFFYLQGEVRSLLYD